MKCRDALELIHAYIDNGIDPANDKLLQEHLDSCEKCRNELRFLQNYKSKLAAIKPVKAPAGFMYELRRRIEAEQTRPYMKYFDAAADYIRSIHFPAEAAALVVLVSIVFTLYRPDKLFMHRVTAPVTEYSETSGIDRAEKIGRDPVTPVDQPSLKSYEETLSSRKTHDADDMLYPGEKEKVKTAETTEKFDTGETDGSVKRESAGAEELAASSDSEVDFNITEKSSDDKKDAYRSESRVMGKTGLDAATVITPKDVCRRYNAEVVSTKKLAGGPVEYTIEIKDNNTDELLSGLRRYFTVKFKSKETRNGHTYLVIEIIE